MAIVSVADRSSKQHTCDMAAVGSCGATWRDVTGL
jgi:hypothetical protein